MLKAIDCCRKVNYFSRNISIYKILHNEDSKSSKPKRKVTETVELVNLVDQNDKILGLKPKPESEKLARKLNLLLQRVTDSKYGKMYPAYKMVSPIDMLKTEKQPSSGRVLKKLPINCRITDNDLVIKIQIIKKWLAKNCEVHVTVLGNQDSQATMKTLFNKLKEQFKNEYRILNVREKEGATKFIVLPPKAPPKNAIQNKQQEESVEGG